MAPNAKELKLRQFILDEFEAKNDSNQALKNAYEKFGSGCIKPTKVNYWFRRFKRGNKILSNDECTHQTMETDAQFSIDVSQTKLNDHISENEDGDSDESISFNENLYGGESASSMPLDEKKLRSQLPKIVINYANGLKDGREFRGFAQRIRDSIWNHFFDENRESEQFKNNRPLPGFDERRNQVKQAQGTLSRLFNQITTPIQLSLFIRDYVSVLKSSNSVENLNQRLLTTISEHQNRGQELNFLYKFCAIQ